jgi:hypothetical protein
VVVGGAHDLVPQVAGAHLAVDPQAVVALVAAGRLDVGGGLGLVGQFHVAIGLDGLHERSVTAMETLKLVRSP